MTSGRGKPFAPCPLVAECVRHAGHRGECKVRVDGKVRPLGPRRPGR